MELKGRVACEIHSHEVLLTELLFQNVFSEYEPGEIAALLSCIIFQQVRCGQAVVTFDIVGLLLCKAGTFYYFGCL